MASIALSAGQISGQSKTVPGSDSLASPPVRMIEVRFPRPVTVVVHGQFGRGDELTNFSWAWRLTYGSALGSIVRVQRWAVRDGQTIVVCDGLLVEVWQFQPELSERFSASVSPYWSSDEIPVYPLTRQQ